MATFRVVHYVNQFFAGVGAEDRAGEPPQLREGPVGPGQVLQRALGDAGNVVATVFCGDNFFSEREDADGARIVELIRGAAPDLVVAGPAFNAGRYGLACGRVAAAVAKDLGIPCVTGMHPENPAVEMYRQQVHIIASGPTPVSMTATMERMATLGLKLARRERIGSPSEEGYLPRGLRFTELAPERAATRAVDMLLRSVRGERWETEWPLPPTTASSPRRRSRTCAAQPSRS